MGNSSFNYGTPANNDIRYSSISLESELNKSLEKDANGYYKICLGAINSFNKKYSAYYWRFLRKLLCVLLISRNFFCKILLWK